MMRPSILDSEEDGTEDNLFVCFIGNINSDDSYDFNIIIRGVVIITLNGVVSWSFLNNALSSFKHCS